MDMPAGWLPMPAPTALAMYTEMRDMPYCSDNVSAEECDEVVMNDPWHNWNYADLMYARTTALFLFAGIVVAGLGNLVLFARQRKASLSLDPMYIWIAGLARYANSKQWRFTKTWYSLTLGQSIVISVMILFFSVLTLGPKPYYWPNPVDFGSSPPIATRAGYMAIGILPFQVVLATKWNLITCFTGVSHEKLQVYHRWLGWIMFVLSLVHTFPFIVVDIQTGTMAEKMATDWYTVSGIICLVPLGVLVAAFIGPIRNKLYEISKSIHFIIAAFFIVTLFLHCGFTMTSAYYFVALAAAYSSSWLIRFAVILKNGFSHRATIHLSDQLLLVTIPTTLHWKPGQHYFLRFMTNDLHMLTSHPFTVASIPQDGQLDLVIKPKGGMTASLVKHSQEGSKPLRVVIDGPYGGLGADFGVFDRVVIMAAGSGLSFLLGTARDLLRRGIATRSITIVYVSRSEGELVQISAEIECVKQVLELALDLEPSAVEVDIFPHLSILPFTEAAHPLSKPAEDEVSEKEIADERQPMLGAKPRGILPARPMLSTYIQKATRGWGTVGIAVCGPDGFIHDARNAVAAEQMKIVRGETDCTECYLHAEVFGW